MEIVFSTAGYLVLRYREIQATKNATGLLRIEVEFIQVKHDLQYLFYRVLPPTYFNDMLTDAFGLNITHRFFDLLMAQLIRFAIYCELHLTSPFVLLMSLATYHTYYHTTSTYFANDLTDNPVDVSVHRTIEDARDDGEEYTPGDCKRVGEGGSPATMPAWNAPRSGPPKKAAMQVGGGGWRPRTTNAE